MACEVRGEPGRSGGSLGVPGEAWELRGRPGSHGRPGRSGGGLGAVGGLGDPGHGRLAQPLGGKKADGRSTPLVQEDGGRLNTIQ